jgi:hypothetical protein
VVRKPLVFAQMSRVWPYLAPDRSWQPVARISFSDRSALPRSVVTVLASGGIYWVGSVLDTTSNRPKPPARNYPTSFGPTFFGASTPTAQASPADSICAWTFFESPVSSAVAG